MAVVERIEYELEERLLDEAAASVVPVYVPKPPPTFDRHWYGILITTAGACLSTLYVAKDEVLPTEFYVVVGLGLVLCLFAMSIPFLIVQLDKRLVRLTQSAQMTVRRRLEESWGGLLHTTIRWEFDEDGFRSETIERARTSPWTTLKRVRIYPRFWCLSTTGRDELLLPTEHLSDAVKSILRRKSAEMRVKIQERTEPN